MPGIPTEHLADLIQQTNERLGQRISESNQHLADRVEASNNHLTETNQRLSKAIEDLTRKAEEGQKGLADFKVDVTGKLSSIQGSLAWAKVIAIFVVVPAVFGLAAYSYTATDRAARIEQSIIDLRDHAKEQDARIGKLIELQIRETSFKGKPPVSHNGPAPEGGKGVRNRC
jgi:hypothetical protein